MFPFRRALTSTKRSLSPPGCPAAPPKSQTAAVMAAPAPCLTPRSQQRLAPQTPSSPTLKPHHSPLPSSPTAQSHPPRSRGSLTLHLLELELTATVPNTRLTPRGVIPPPVTTGAHEAQAVTWIESLLRAPQLLLLSRHLGLPRSSPPPPTC